MTDERNLNNPTPSVHTGGLRSYTPMQLFLLTRLASLIRQRRELVNTLDPSDSRMKLLNKALYSTFLDCAEEGVGDDAKNLLAQQNQNAN
ncbi:MAG: hypothetical protein GEU73_16445 [Chloroflexi bacterium]|nr:hypothetical protein [Chloroflexota bacterium]